MTLCHVRRRWSLPERAAQSIPHTWQHGLKIAQKPLIHHYRIFAGKCGISGHSSPDSVFAICSVTHIFLPVISLNLSLISSSILFLFFSLPLYFILALFLGFANQLLIDFIRQAKQETQQDRKSFHHSTLTLRSHTKNMCGSLSLFRKCYFADWFEWHFEITLFSAEYFTFTSTKETHARHHVLDFTIISKLFRMPKIILQIFP